MRSNNHCIQCELLERSRKKLAKHWVEEGGQSIPLCDEHYEEWLLERDIIIDIDTETKEDSYGDIL